MRPLITTLRRAVTRARLAMAASDLAFMEARAPHALAQQRAHVRALAARLDTLEAGLCNPCPAEPIPAPRADDVRARIERELKEALL